MRVMQCIAGAKHGGAEAFFTRLVLALHRAGLDQHVVLRANSGREKQLTDGGVTVQTLVFGGKLDISTRLKLRREITRYKPQVVLSWMNRAAAFCPPPRGRFVHCGRLGGYYELKNYHTCDHLVGNTGELSATWWTGAGLRLGCIICQISSRLERLILCLGRNCQRRTIAP